MADPYVREVGSVEGLDGEQVRVGVDYDTVTIRTVGLARLAADGQEELAQLLVSAVWQAGQQKAALIIEANDG